MCAQLLQLLQDSHLTLTFIEHEVSAQYEQPGYSLPEHVHHLKSNVQSLQRLYASCETAASHIENSVPFYPQRLEGQGPGRPALNITKEQIEYLRSIHFSWEKVAQLLHISVSTLQRRRRVLEISEDFDQYSDISDHE